MKPKNKTYYVELTATAIVKTRIMVGYAESPLDEEVLAIEAVKSGLDIDWKYDSVDNGTATIVSTTQVNY